MHSISHVVPVGMIHGTKSNFKFKQKNGKEPKLKVDKLRQITKSKGKIVGLFTFIMVATVAGCFVVNLVPISDDGGPVSSAPPVVDYTKYGTDYAGMVTKLTSLATLFPNYAELIDLNTLYSVPGIPKTGGGTYDMYVLRITNESLGLHKPEVLLQGGIHGDEQTSPSALIWFADWFLRYSVGYTGRVPPDTNYNGFENEYLQWLINNREIYVLPAFNPDGIVRNVRQDQTGRDMNRNFDWNVETSPSMATRNEQCIREFLNHHQVRVGVGAHDGAHFVCYPMDSIRSGVTGRTIAATYSLPARKSTTQTYAPPDYYWFDSFLSMMINYTGNTPDGYFGSGGSYQGNFCPGGHWYSASGCQDTFMYSSNEPDSYAYTENDGVYPGAGSFWCTIEYSTTKNTPAGEFGDDSSTPTACWVAGAKRQMLYFIDMAQPYIRWDKIMTPANHSKILQGSQITLKWQVNGSLVCDDTRVQWGTNTNPKTTYSYTTTSNTTYNKKWVGGTGWNAGLDGKTTSGTWFQQTITLPSTPGHYYFVARAKVDSAYAWSKGNLTGGSVYTKNTYLRMLRERTPAGASWSENIAGTDGTESMTNTEYWYSPVLHIQVIADPIVNITTPVENGDVYGNNFAVLMSASDADSAITAVDVQVNGGAWVTGVFQSGTTWRALVDFSGYTEGSTVTLTARVINNDIPAVTKYSSRLAKINNYMPPTVQITNLINGSTQNVGSALPVTWTVNGARVYTIDKTQLYWTNGTRMLSPQRPLDSYGGSPITFDTVGSNGYFYTTGNTFGAAGADDGWDWARNLGYVAASTGAMTTFHDPDGNSGPLPHSQVPHSIEVEVGGLANTSIDSGAFGIKFYVDAGLGLRSVTVGFKWWAYDRVIILSAGDETEEALYVKARFGSVAGGMTYLQGTGAQGGDAAADVIYWTTANGAGAKSYSGTESINVTALVSGSGWYYLELGAVSDPRAGSQDATEGICAFFDDIDITVNRYKIVTDACVPGHVNRWNSVAKSGAAGIFSDTITLPNLPGQKCYIIANASSDGQSEERRSLIWEINLIASGVSITNTHVMPGSGPISTTFTIHADVGSANPISRVYAYIEAPDETPIATITLTSLGNGTYSGTWNSGGQPRRTYYVDYFANNTLGESLSVNNGATFQIVNSLPSITGANISPSTAYKTSTLTAVPNGWSDIDGDPAGYTYRWFRNGVVIAGQTASTLGNANFNKGNTIIVEITPYDGFGYGTPRNSSVVTIQNSAPSITTATITPSPAYKTSTLTATASGWSDADGDAAGYTYRWFRNGAVIAGQTASTLGNANFNKGNAIIVEITPFDGTASGTPVNSSAITIQNSAPSITTATITPSPAYKTSTLTATASGWIDADGDAAGYTYRWFRNGAVIAGQTSSTLGNANFNKGNTIIVEITPFDGTASGTPRNSSGVVIQNSAPSITTATITPSPAYKTSTLTATASGWSDADGDAAGYTYRWFRNGAVIAGQTASTLGNANFNKGNTIIVEITPFDGTASGTPVNSSTTTIQNSAPSITTATITPSPAYKTSTLTATASGWSDADGDAAGYTYRWFRNGAVIAGQTASTLGNANFNKGNTIIVEITPFDGTASGTPVNSSTTTIQNSAPSISVVDIAPILAYKTSTLIATASGWNDLDGDSADYTYRWFNNGIVIPGQTGITLAPLYFIKANSIIVEITPFDGTSSGTALNSSALIISNSQPTAPTTMTPRQTSSLSPLITWSGATDPDSDPLSYYFQLVNGTNPIQIIIGWQLCAAPSYQVLSPLLTNKSYIVQLVAWDGTINSSLFQDYLNTTNSVPYWTLPGNFISPDSTLNPFPTITWTAATEPDGQTVTYLFNLYWVNAGMDVVIWQSTGTVRSFIIGTELIQGNYLVQIRAYDGVNFSDTLEEALIILNTAPTFTGCVLNTTTAYETSTIEAVPSGWDDINSMDDGYWAYDWVVNTVVVFSGVTNTVSAPILLNGTYFNKHDNVACRIRAVDYRGAMSGTMSTPSIIISNTAPVITDISIVINGSQYLQNETLYPSVTTVDPDNDPITLSFNWYVAPLGGNYSLAFTGPFFYDPLRHYFKCYDSIIVCAAVSDGEVQGLPVNSSMVEIQNSKPGICSNAFLDSTAGVFLIPVVRWSPAPDADGGFQTYFVYMGTGLYKSDLLEMSRVSAPYAALCYRYITNQSIFRGAIYVHIFAIDEFQLMSDQMLVFICTYDAPADNLGPGSNPLNWVLGISALMIIGGIAVGFFVTRRMEHSIDVEGVAPAKKLPTKKGKKTAGQPVTKYQELPLKSQGETELKPKQPAPLTAEEITACRNRLQDLKGWIKMALDTKDYNGAMASLQEMIGIAEKIGDTTLAENYKKKAEDLVKMTSKT
nr:M14 family zinc carboxypeptidase [Candidatus Sigynarchaeota archaeon]